ncbi:hypothetical protein E2C01_060868 [Portunus trituberculatus]|uniref:Uncharacterized protein n=1 Tax=Portunus trituberculatus TaxID=210409 RepID=A0A5B7H9V7_PORTR|nr:hypothetical protein [Portunus trituberculatus]
MERRVSGGGRNRLTEGGKGGSYWLEIEAGRGAYIFSRHYPPLFLFFSRSSTSTTFFPQPFLLSPPTPSHSHIPNYLSPSTPSTYRLLPVSQLMCPTQYRLVDSGL